jgi:peptide chain release factor subunit 1
VTGIVLAGAAEFKNELRTSGLLDQRLDACILCVLDVSYGGDNGFTQAIELAGETLAQVKFIREKKLISRFFEEIATDSRKFTYGIDNTLKTLEMGAIEKLIVWDSLETIRVKTRNSATGIENVMFITPEQAADQATFYDESTGFELEKLEEQALSEWLVENYTNFGASLEFITDKSPEGN